MDHNLREKDWFDSRFFTAIAWTMLYVVMCMQILACLGAPVHQYDDAIPLVSSELVALGRTPAVDFKSFYPPLYYFVVAAAFRIVGRSVLVIRFIAAALYLISMSAIILFFRNSFTNLRPLVAYMSLAVAVAIGTVSYPQWPAFALSLLSLLAYLHSRQSSRPTLLWLAVAGALAGVSTLVRFNFGLYVATVVGADILLTEVLQTPKNRLSVRVRYVLLQVATFGGLFAAVNLGFYLTIYGTHAIVIPWQMMSYSMRLMGSHGFLRIRPRLEILLPLGFPCAWSFVHKAIRLDRLPTAALIPVAAAAALVTLVLLGGGRPSISLWFPALSFLTVIALHLFVIPFSRAVVCLLLFYVCLQHYFLARADAEHTILFFPIIALTLPFLFASPARANADGRSYPPMPRGLLFLALIAASYAMIATRPDLRAPAALARNTLAAVSSGGLDPWIPDRKRLPLTDPSLSDEIRATEFLRQRTAPSALIFVGVADHSKSFINDVRVYWLCERLPGVTYINIDSGIASEKTVQREIVAELQRNHVNWAILYNSAGTGDEYLFQKVTSGSRVLDEFFNTQFQEQAHFGRYSVITRKQP